METIQHQLYAAFTASGMSVGQLLTQSGLELDPSSLNRKLRGVLRLNTAEAEAIARALKHVIVFPQVARRVIRRRVAA